jgi:hypothetical protein
MGYKTAADAYLPSAGKKRIPPQLVVAAFFMSVPLVGLEPTIR